MPGYDDVTVEQLRAAGSLKWTAFPDALGAFVAEMDLGVAPPVLAALHEAVDRSGFGYLPAALRRALGESCADWQRHRYGWAVDPGAVKPVGHVLEALQIIITRLSEPGCPVVLPTPAYMPFLLLPATLGRELVEVAMVDDGTGRTVHDLDALDRTFTRLGSAVLVLTNPHNPTGTVATRAELLALSEVVARHDVRVLADEVHGPLVYPGARHVPYASVSPVAAGHSMTATSASKAWNLPGLKCAQLIITNDADAAAWAEIDFFSTMGASNLGVVASVAAYRDGAAWLDDVLGYLDGSRRRLAELVAEHLPGVRYRPPDGTYLAWLDAREAHVPEDAGRFFREAAGVALTDGRACGAAGRGFVRLNFATPRPVLEQMVTRMGAALRDR